MKGFSENPNIKKPSPLKYNLEKTRMANGGRLGSLDDSVKKKLFLVWWKGLTTNPLFGSTWARVVFKQCLIER